MDSYFLIKTDVMGLINDIKKTPKIIDTILGIIITEKFDIPEIFIAKISSVFLIFRKNQIPDNKIINGSISYIKVGTIIKDSRTGIKIPISTSLKKFISSNKFIKKPKQTKTIAHNCFCSALRINRRIPKCS